MKTPAYIYITLGLHYGVFLGGATYITPNVPTEEGDRELFDRRGFVSVVKSKLSQQDARERHNSHLLLVLHNMIV